MSKSPPLEVASPALPRTSSRLDRLRKAAYAGLALLILTVFALSIAQMWFIYSASDLPGYGSVQADERGWPAPERRGAFIMLNEPHNPIYAGNLVELLATTEPGVVDAATGAHFLPGEIKSILVQSAAIGEPNDYRLYRLAEAESTRITAEPQPGGDVIILNQADGTWEPGAYIVDVPAEGMFGGRTYFQFYVDAVN